MPGLTVTEKEHWKDRIASRIDKKIEAISAVEPNLMGAIHQSARQRALESLGLAQMQLDLDVIERQKNDLEEREVRIERAMLAQVRGVPVEEISEHQCYRHEQEVENAVRRRQTVHEDELLAESELGRRILQLRAERENLLDTVWLASSPRHIKELWSKVSELLGDEQTQLQRDALAIQLVED